MILNKAFIQWLVPYWYFSVQCDLSISNDKLTTQIKLRIVNFSFNININYFNQISARFIIASYYL